MFRISLTKSELNRQQTFHNHNFFDKIYNSKIFQHAGLFIYQTPISKIS